MRVLGADWEQKLANASSLHPPDHTHAAPAVSAMEGLVAYDSSSDEEAEEDMGKMVAMDVAAAQVSE